MLEFRSICRCRPAKSDSSPPAYLCPDCHLPCPDFGRKTEPSPSVSQHRESSEAKATVDDGTPSAAPRSDIVCRVTDLEPTESEVVTTEDERLDAVLGGGVTLGGIYLLGGAPGAGKSTLLMEVARGFLLNQRRVLYVSAEEGPEQARARCERLGVLDDELFVCCETDVALVLEAARYTEAQLLLLDSVQRLHTDRCNAPPGSPSQIQAVCERLLCDRPQSAAVFLVGHVTKAGDLAGPKFLEHMVDVVLSLTRAGDDGRRLSSTKNRFGACCSSEFEMTPEGLR